VSGFVKEDFDPLVWFSHHYVRELLAGLVKAQTSSRVHHPPQFLQFLCGKATQVQLQEEEQGCFISNSTFKF